MNVTLSQNLRLTQSQQLVLTPQLQQAIKLLQLNQLELAAMVTQEMETNPVLEEVQESPSEQEEADESSESAAEKRTLAEDSKDRQENREAVLDMDWNQYCDNRGVSGSSRSNYDQNDAPAWDYNLSSPQTLSDHLFWQLQMTPLLNKSQSRIGEAIIYNINDDGYLDTSVEDLAAECAASPADIEEVLAKIRLFDPVGVASRSLEECILTQMIYLGLDDDLNREIVSHHLKLLQNKNYKKIARLLKVEEEQVIESIKTILTIDPKPGRQYSGTIAQSIIPDLYIFKSENNWVIVLNEDRIPRLAVNRYYRDLADQQKDFNPLTRNYLVEKIRSAQWLIKSIEQRQKTIYKVMKSILHFQQDFFDRGPHHLHPLILRDIADDISMHESTVSRVTQNKYVQTPHGIFELKYFFNSSIHRSDGDDDIASESVKHKILDIIAQESPDKPASDKAIARILQEEHNINIARRTIAKYRDMLGILSSSRRKKIF
ncbi:MAG: RNA polymerase factor sigma-54 [Deltaproteobacteria bacterium]|nr:RNA polymerase factor sigma-54 [Candidatus Anaeroferrophillus wilburensis]MBN2889459.1 RNA polymerase factor sigma-54 [Deltaproteobacteria bacterium]